MAAQAWPVLSARSLERGLVRELESALTPWHEGNPAAARARLDRLLDATGSVDLGPLGYARALRLGLAGEPERAAAALDDLLAHDPAPPQTAARLAAQIYLDALREQVSQRALDVGQVHLLAQRALDLRQRPAIVAAIIGDALATPRLDPAAEAMRRALLTRLADAGKPAPTSSDLPIEEARREPEPLALTLHSLSGKRIDLESLRGRVVLLHFWAEWCPVSAAEAPTLVAAFERFHTRGLQVIGIAADDDGDAVPVRAAAARLHLTWEHVLDGEALSGPLALRFGVESLPAAILLDRRGVLRASGESLRGDALAPRIEKLLDEPPPPISLPRRERDRDQDRR